MTVRSGGKVCWGGAGAIPPIPTYTETETLLLARDSSPADANPAPLRDVSFPLTDASFPAIEFTQNASMSRVWSISNRWIAKPGTAFYTVNVQVNAFCAGASLNNIEFQLNHYSGSSPAGDYSSAFAVAGNVINPGLGAIKMMRFNFQFNTAGDVYILHLQRQGDANPDLVYVPHILMYFNQALA